MLKKYETDSQATDANIIRRWKSAICLPDNQDKNTNTHSEYVIPIAFPLQQWLRERAAI
jgi:hypothetical protein